jgi:hypothetical protein
MAAKQVLEVIFLLALPAAVFVGGGSLMSSLSGRPAVRPSTQRPLNLRLFGYDVGAVTSYWTDIEEPGAGLQAEQRFLELDLIFPFFYGAAYASSCLLAWAWLGRPFNPAWVFAPVIITVAADWIENLVLLDQIKKFQALGAAALEPRWVQVASVATISKVFAFIVMTLVLVWLAGRLALQAIKSP